MLGQLEDEAAAVCVLTAVGLVEYQPNEPLPEGYVPPFTTGECVSLDAACP